MHQKPRILKPADIKAAKGGSKRTTAKSLGKLVGESTRGRGNQKRLPKQGTIVPNKLVAQKIQEMVENNGIIKGEKGKRSVTGQSAKGHLPGTDKLKRAQGENLLRYQVKFQNVKCFLIIVL